MTPSTPRTPNGTAPTWTVGDLRVHRIDETELPGATGQWLLPDATPDVVRGTPWLHPDFATADGALRLATHSFAVETNGLRVLVDTGIGNGKTRANPAWHDLDTPYPDRLTAAGFPPESVDLVVLTHLHADHVGWNTRDDGGTWVPTFPRARYLTSRTEWDFWASRELEPPRAQMFRDSVHPVREAGLLDLVDVPGTGSGPGSGPGSAPGPGARSESGPGVEVAPGVRLLPAPGHTPGQVAVELSSAGSTALITGDSVHHPVQLAHPHLTSCVDIDPAEAVRTRNRLLAAHSDALLLGSHFPHPTTVTRTG